MRVAFILAASASVAFFAIRQFLRGAFFDGLSNVVSFSARLIAAARAEENCLEDAYVRDPLAAVLAGQKAVTHRKAALGKGKTTTALQEPGPRPISRIIFRTVFFDQAIQAAVGLEPSAAFFKDLLCAMGGSHQVVCTQVVLLGSGMDTRPWRLKLPPGIAWFEVDQAEVLNAKQQLLGREGVAFTADGPMDQLRFPLRCSKWAGVPLDLQCMGWTDKLKASGFKTDMLTIWVLEGLLYYLEPDTVPNMLKEAASISASGSALVASIVNKAFIDELKQKPIYSDKTNIMSAWKWGCPSEPATFFGDCGWKVLSHPTWTSAAEAFGYKHERSTPSQRAAKIPEGQEATKPTGGVQYVTAVVETSPQ